MNMTLFKYGFKQSWKLWLVLFGVMTLYITVVISMYNPSLGSILDEFSKQMPELMALFGMADTGNTLIEFMASYLYGMIFLIFPMLYSIIISNRLIAKKIDQGSMAYLLAAPVTRKKIALTQLFVLLSGLILLIITTTGIGAISAQVLFPGQLNTEMYIQLNLNLMFVHVVIAGICFLSSSLFNETKWSIAFGAGVPVLCYVIQMIANLGGNYSNAKYLTFFTLFDPSAILQSGSWISPSLFIMIILGLSLFLSAVTVFTKKDIPV